MTDHILSDGVVTLRAVEVTDVAALMMWENDSSQWDTSCPAAPFSHRQMWEYASSYDGDIAASGGIRLMVTLQATGQSVGTIDLYDYNAMHRRASIGVFIAPGLRRKGYARRAVAIAVGYARHIGLNQLTAEVAADNEASAKLMASCGFEARGTLKEWFRRGKSYADALIMQRPA